MNGAADFLGAVQVDDDEMGEFGVGVSVNWREGECCGGGASAAIH